jgi:hypothetical protein
MDSGTAIKLARKLMDKHGLEHWGLEINRSVNTLGLCNTTRKTIKLSEHHIKHNSDEEIVETMLHEIAHAFANMMWMDNCGHDKRWKQVAKIIGCRPERCLDVAIPVPPKWEMWDHSSNKQVRTYYKRPIGYRNISDWAVKGREEETRGRLELRRLK